MKNKIKKKFIILILLSCFFIPISVDADEMLFERSNANIVKDEYLNLIELGFTENEINNMSSIELQKNFNVTGKVVASDTKYYKITNSTIVSEISKDKYDKVDLQSSLQSTGFIETTYKKVTTKIIDLSNYYRYKISVEWKLIPQKRSYDIIGIGMDSNVSITGSITFQQNYCYETGNCYTSSAFVSKISANGAAALFQLPTSNKVNSLNSYMYYTVAKNTSSTISVLNAYGDYSHATVNTQQSYINNFTINSLGIVLDSSIKSKYDEIPISKATASVNW